MKLGWCQQNAKVGAVAENAHRVLEAIRSAKQQKVTVLLFPELTLVGYPPQDLLDYDDLISLNLEWLEKIAAEARGITVVVGYVDRNPEATGKPWVNAAAVLKDGKICRRYRKQLLPSYDVFDEQRYFEAGTDPGVFEVDGVVFGVTICEDAWNLPGFLPRLYAASPFAELKRREVDVLLNLSASPFYLGRAQTRLDLFADAARFLEAPVLFCNQVGANDELLFDGCSFALSAEGEVRAASPAFTEAVGTIDLAALRAPSSALTPSWPSSDSAWLENALVLGVRDYVRKCKAQRLCLGLSGGIDSSVVAAIAVNAVGAPNVLGVSLPSRFTSSASREDAKKLAENLGMEFREFPIDAIFELYAQQLGAGLHSLTLENLQPRIRMTILMAFANEGNRLLLNTSNKSEMATGFSTLYGDSAGALAVLGDLTKGQVYALARYWNRSSEVIPQRILDRAPSAELKADQTDQDILPPYDVLDAIVEANLVHRQSPRQLLAKGFPADAVATYGRMHQASEYKRRQGPPVLRVSSRAFGLGRRVPIAAEKSP